MATNEVRLPRSQTALKQDNRQSKVSRKHRASVQASGAHPASAHGQSAAPASRNAANLSQQLLIREDDQGIDEVDQSLRAEEHLLQQTCSTNNIETGAHSLN